MLTKKLKIKIKATQEFNLEYYHYSVSNFKPATKSLFLYLHGLPGGPLPELDNVPKLLGEIGFDTIAFNYPGLWNTQGLFTANYILTAINGLLEHLKKRVNPASVSLFGESFGGTIAFNILGRKLSPIPIENIILRSPLLSFKSFLQTVPYTLTYLQQTGIMNGDTIEPMIKSVKSIDPEQFFDESNKQEKIKIWGVIGRNDKVLSADEMIKAVQKYRNINIELWEDFPHNDINFTLYKKFFTKAQEIIQKKNLI